MADQVVELGLVRVVCEHCSANVEMRTSAFHLRLFDTGLNARLQFFCSGCKGFNSRGVSSVTIHWLIRHGIAKSIEHVPLEALELTQGPPVTEDEVRDFVFDLEMAQHERLPLEGPRSLALDPRV